MGNCLISGINHTLKKLKCNVSVPVVNKEKTEKLEQQNEIRADHLSECTEPVPSYHHTGDKINEIVISQNLNDQQVSVLNESSNLSQDNTDLSDKHVSSWTNFVNSSQPDGDIRRDMDIGFAENWDPSLFDHCNTPAVSNSGINFDETALGPLQYFRRGLFENRIRDKYKASYCQSNAVMGTHLPGGLHFPLISSSILGFSPLLPSMVESMEWYRNGEIETTQADRNNFLNNCKHTRSDENDFKDNSKVSEKPVDIPSCDIIPCREGWLRYTMFLVQDQSGAATFYTNFRKAKHKFLSLEAMTGCEIRLSKCLFVHRGKLVRTVVIDGPSRRQIIRCRSSLPKPLMQLMITDHEYPSINEPKSVQIFAPEDEAIFKPSISALQKTPLVA